MTTLVNSFEGGSNTTTISTGNSGGVSGNAFDSVTIGALAGVTFSSTHAAHGFLSCAIATGSPGANALLTWTTSLTATTVPQAWFRAYFYLTAYSGNLRVIRVQNAGTLCGAVAFNASAKVSLLDSAGTGQKTSTTTLPANQWFRIEGFVIGSASVGQVQAQIYLAEDSPTPTETLTTAATLNTTGAMNRVDFGNPASVASFTYWLDDVGASTTGYIGPSVTRRSTSIVPSLIAAGVLA